MIAVDWGGSSLRAYRLDDDGRIVDRRRSDRGVLSCDGRFAEELARQIAGWDDARILLCGMIGSRSGWAEVPYVACPGDTRDVAAGVLALPSDTGDFAGRRVLIVPGMIDHASGAVADVMRGEETQIIGLLDGLDTGAYTICLPGTHSKWVRVRDGTVVSIRTTMTGEAYGLFRKHSVLARLMTVDEPSLDIVAFEEGLARSGDAGGFLHHLFGVRTLGLLGQLTEFQSPSYLSGLLIGHEVRAQANSASSVHLIGNDQLQTRYTHALQAFGIEVRNHPEELAAIGLHRIAQLTN